MPESLQARRAAFRELHREGCFLLPNPWDAASARRLAAMGFAALASTSSGAAAAVDAACRSLLAGGGIG